MTKSNRQRRSEPAGSALRSRRPGRSRRAFRRVFLGAFLAAWLGSPGVSSAYSYAAAGAEPLIEAREATLAALQSGDRQAAIDALEQAKEELAYLDSEFEKDYGQRLRAAVQTGDAAQVDGVYLEAFRTEVERRLAAAGDNLEDYQTAKTLVVRAKRFLDLLSPALEAGAAERARDALGECLAAIGNPGVFGVGATEADPAAFEAQRRRVSDALASL